MFFLYLFFRSRVDIVNAKLESNLKSSNHDLGRDFLNFGIYFLYLQLFFFGLLASLVKFLVILFLDASKGFGHLFAENRQEQYSYSQYKIAQRQLRVFSLGGVMTIVATSSVIGLVLNLVFGGGFFTRAATFGWDQTRWEALPNPSFVALHDQVSRGNSSTTAYYSKDALIKIIAPAPADSSISEATTSGNLMQTNDSTTTAGFNIPDTVNFQTQIRGAGADAQVSLAAQASTTFNFGEHFSSTVNVSGVNYAVWDEANNKIFVADTGNQRIVSFDSGFAGTTYGAHFQAVAADPLNLSDKFNGPVGVTVDSQLNKIFVSDSSNHRIVMFDSGTGGTVFGENWHTLILSKIKRWNPGIFDYEYLFVAPQAISVDTANKRVYVALNNIFSCLKFLSYDSNSITDVGGLGDCGSAGSDQDIGYFSGPSSVSVDNVNHKVFISEVRSSVGGRIVSFDANATVDYANWASTTNVAINASSQIVADGLHNALYQTYNVNMANVVRHLDSGTGGTTLGYNKTTFNNNISEPLGVAIDQVNNSLFVVVASNHLLRMNSASNVGGFGNSQHELAGLGTDQNQYNAPTAVSVDDVNHRLFVADSGNNRIVAYDSGVVGSTLSANWATIGSFGSGVGQLNNPQGLYVDGSHNKLYIADTDNNRIIRCDSGTGSTTFGNNWESAVVVKPASIVYDAASNKLFVLISSAALSKVVILDATAQNFGSLVGGFGTIGSSTNQFSIPSTMFLDSEFDKLYIADTGNDRVIKIDAGLASTSLGANWLEYSSLNNPQLLTPHGVYVDTRNNSNLVYVTSQINNKLIAFDSGEHGTTYGQNPRYFGGLGSVSDTFSTPIGLGGSQLSNQLFVVDSANSRLALVDMQTVVDTYFSTGTYTSGITDVGQFTTAWGAMTAGIKSYGQTISLKVRAAAKSDMSDAVAWSSCAPVTVGGSLASGGCMAAGQRYLQYQVNLSTNNNFLTPVLNDITFNFDYYPSNQSIVSAIYDSSADGNVMGTFSWKENTDAFIGGRVAMRLASTSALIATSTWQDIDMSKCTKNSGTGEVTCLYSSLPAGLRNSIDSRFFQYKFTIQSDGYVQPHVYSVRTEYIVNSAPEVILTAPVSQSANGKVSINFTVVDSDTLEGVMPNKVILGLEYFDSGTWKKASSTYLAGSGQVTVDASNTTAYMLTWEPARDYPGKFFASTSLRVTAYDGEQANNTGYAPLSLRLDTRAPDYTHLLIDAYTFPTTLSFDTTDDSQYYMRLGFSADLSDSAGWLPYAATSTVQLINDNTNVYVQFKDEFENTSAIVMLSRPETPKNVFIRDLTSPATGIYQEFVAWVKDTATTNFKQYVVYRSTSSDPSPVFERYAVIPDKQQNFFFDNNLDTNLRYSYRIVAENQEGSLSRYVTTVSDIPDGQVANVVAPVISSVMVATTTTQTATIEWETNIPANSTIGYSATPANFDREVGIATFADRPISGAYPDSLGIHEVTVTGLNPSTTYYFRVKSIDASGNFAQLASGTDGFTFTTKPGPIISNASTTSVTNSQATIIWDTDVPADSIVSYSADFNMNSQIDVSNQSESTTTHVVVLQNLAANTQYYYYVHSRDAAGYEAIGRDETATGSPQNFTFTTLKDNDAPTIVDGIVCKQLGDTGLSLRWLTNKPAIGAAAYGTTSNFYPDYTGYNSTSTYNLSQTLDIINLVSSTTYYFRVNNRDIFGNVSTSSEYSCDTGQKVVSEVESQAKISQAYQNGLKAGSQPAPVAPPASSGGGGMLIIDKTDKVPPIITNVKVTQIQESTAMVSWSTSEPASSFVVYGTSSLNQNWGMSELTLQHSARLTSLIASSSYTFFVLSADASGNLASSSRQIFVTKPAKASTSLGASGQVAKANSKLRDYIDHLLAGLKLDNFDGSLLAEFNLLDQMSQNLPGPAIIGQPLVEVEANSVVISWRTDKKANSMVALANDDAYTVNKSKKEPYLRFEGDANDFTLDHRVVIKDLTPGTGYHYQVRSKAQIGKIVVSNDFTFRTKEEQLEITSYNVQNLSADKIMFRWLTSDLANSIITYIPYRGNQLAVEETKTLMDKSITKAHELLVENLDPGVNYQVTLAGLDAKNRRFEKLLPTLSTQKDDLPPEITQIQTDSALSQGKNKKVQTIMSWYTDEPTISQITFEKGALNKETYAEMTPIETNYTKKHVTVLTSFEPGQVYSFRIIAIDSSGNKSVSPVHTVLAPRQSEGVFDLIMKNFESTFGWLKNVGN